MSDASALAAAYDHVRRAARAASSSFYPAFFLLPHPKRDALCALYDFMRRADDISDTPSDLTTKQNRLADLRVSLNRVVAKDTSGDFALLALADTISRYRIPVRYFHDLLTGVEDDFTENSYATFDDLRLYCYRVAGTVGITCTHVFGFDDPRALELADRLGLAFQLTNILRDISADLALGRIYIPAEDLSRFAVTPEDLTRRPLSPAALELLAFEIHRAWQFYEEGVAMLPLVHADSRAALWMLARTYSTLLARIEFAALPDSAMHPQVHGSAPERVRLSTSQKFGILARALLGLWNFENVLPHRHRDRRRLGRSVLRRRAG